MGIMRLLPLMYLVAKASAMWLTESIQAHGNTNIENCICPMKSPSIIKKLDSTRSGLERLVIYVYKKPTGEIVSFIPEKEHQRKIPDLPEMNGLIYEEPNPSIKELFEKSSSKDLRLDIEPEDKGNGIDIKIPKNINEKHIESEIVIPKWQIPVDDVISQSHVIVSPENTHKTEILIDNDNFDDSSQQHTTSQDSSIVISSEHVNKNRPISVESPLDICLECVDVSTKSSEYIKQTPNTYEDYTVSVKPLTIDNPSSTFGQSFESHFFEDKSPETSILDIIKSPRQKEQHSFTDSMYFNPHITGKNQISFSELEIPEEVEMPQHKHSIYIRPHMTGKTQISFREMDIPERIELPTHNKQSSIEDSFQSIYFKPFITGKTHISFGEKEIPQSKDYLYIRPHLTEKNQISISRASEEIGLPRQNEKSPIEDIESSSHSIHFRPQIGGKDQISFREDHEDMDPIIQKIQIPQKDKYGTVTGWIQKSVKPYRNSGSNAKDNWTYRYSDEGNSEKDSAYDDWLKEQLKITTLHGHRIPNSATDIIALDKAIRNILLQNGWRVTAHGTLTDGTGKISSLSNLKLRPILVGKSYSYNNILKQGTSTFDTTTPYLEGLLFTMIKPAKVLGIVPLLITEDEQKKMEVLPIEELVAFRKNSKSSKLNAEGSKKKTKGSKEKTKSSKKKAEGSKKTKTDETHLKNALSELQQSEHGRGTTTTISQIRGKVNTGGGNREGGVISEEKPDWRIIGGTSATISGTPLDFKGRSGLPSK